MSEAAHKRSTRVAQLIQKELANMLINEVKDPRIGFVTVTEVRLADDLKNARVYVSIYGSDEQRESSMSGIRKAAGFLRREISHRLKLRETPMLSFELDTSLDRAERIETLLNAVSHGDIETPRDVHFTPAPVQTRRNERPLAEPPPKTQKPRKGRGRNSGRRGGA